MKKLNERKIEQFFLLVMSIGFGFGVLVSSCKKKDQQDDHDHDHTKEINYVFATVGGAFPDQTTFLQGTKDLTFNNLNNSNATEIANWGQIWSSGKAVFVTTFGAPATMQKYLFNEAGVAQKQGEIVVPGANTFSSIYFIDENQGFGSLAGGLAKIVKFNPSTSQITGEIDLTPVLRDSADSHWFLGMAARDGKLFVGVDYQKSFSTLWDSAYVAVIDLQRNVVEKVISDHRTAFIFAGGGAVNGFEQDDNGDIYIIGEGTSNVPSGILRIKKGATTFDPDYFFDLKAATGNPCKGLRLFNANGLAFTCSAQDPDDLWEFNGPNYKYHQINLNNATANPVSNLPITYGSKTSIIRKLSEQELLFVVSNQQEEAIYSYNIGTGTIAKKISLDGQITGFSKLKHLGHH